MASFLDDLMGDDGSGNNASTRMGNILANTAKESAQAEASKYINETTDIAKQAALILANKGANWAVDKIAGTSNQASPKPYIDQEDLGIELTSKDYLVTPKNSYNTYFTKNAGYNLNHPMLSSLFLVDFKFNPKIYDIEIEGLAFQKLMEKKAAKSLTFSLKSMSMPRVSFDWVRINSYNRRKIVPKSVSYDPVSISFNDIYSPYLSTEDDSNMLSLMMFMKEYLSFHTNDVVIDDFNRGEGSRLRNGLAAGDRTFDSLLESIDIYFFWANSAKKISLKNPFIDSFSYGELDYTSDNNLMLTTSIQYEYVDLTDIDISMEDFINKTSGLMSTLAEGHTADYVADTIGMDIDALKPIENAIVDAQRRIGLDNPVAAMAIELAEVYALKEYGGNLTSRNPLRRAIAKGAYSAGLDAIATSTGVVSGTIKGLF